MAVQPCLFNRHVDVQLNQVKFLPEHTWLSSPGSSDSGPRSSTVMLTCSQTRLRILPGDTWLSSHIDLQSYQVKVLPEDILSSPGSSAFGPGSLTR
jgi:hypothetical protein